jgi:putative PEP-CTERM system TPR-repeat lipoprotein
MEQVNLKMVTIKSSISSPISTTHMKSFIFIPLFIILFLTACDPTSDITPGTHIENAKKYLNENQLNASIIELKSALQKDANQPEARWLLGNIYLRYGDGAIAYSELSQAQSLGFVHPELEISLLKALLLQGKFTNIIEKTSYEASQGEPSSETLTLRGNAHMGLNQYQEAKSDFDKALANDTNFVDAKKGLARIALISKDLETANLLITESQSLAPDDVEVWILKGFLLFLKNAPAKETEQAFVKAVSIADHNAVAQFGLIRSFLLQGKYDEALEQIKAVENRYKDHPFAKYFRAYIALQNKEIERAKDLLRNVLKVLPNHAESLLLMGHILYSEKQLEQAKEHLTRFMAKNPNHLPAIKLMSVVLFELKQTDQAITLLEDAVSHSQGDAQLLALLGGTYLRAGKLGKGTELLEQAVALNPEVAATRAQLAIGHLSTGSTNKAVSELESAIDLNPDLLRADILLILTNLKLKNYDAAIKAAKALSDKQPDNPLPYNLLGSAYFAKEDLNSAKKLFEKALSVKANFVPAMINLATIDIKQENIEAAEKRFLDVLKIDNNNSSALVALAKIEADKGNNDNMLKLLQQARANNPVALNPRLLLTRFYLGTGNVKESLLIINEAKGLAPESPEVLLLLGQAQRLNGHSKESLESLKIAADKTPNSHFVFYQLGLTQIQIGDVATGKQSLEKVLTLKPDFLPALATSARVAITEKNYTSARSFVKKIIQAHPESVEADVLTGDVYMAEGKPGDAVKAFQNAFKTVQNSILVTKIAGAYNQADDKASAESTLNEWLKIHPDDIRASLFLASLYQQANDNARAINHYEKILNQDENNTMAMNNLAWLYMDKDPAYSLELAQKAHELSPNFPEITDTLGWILVKQEKIESGLTYLQSALAERPNSPDIQYHVAVALAKSGDKTQAREMLEKLIREHSSFPERDDAEKLLGTLQ